MTFKWPIRNPLSFFNCVIGLCGILFAIFKVSASRAEPLSLTLELMLQFGSQVWSTLKTLNQFYNIFC